MRDQMDAMIWNAHHDQFSEWLDEALTGLGRRFAAAGSTRLPSQLFAAVAAVGLSLITLGGTAA